MNVAPGRRVFWHHDSMVSIDREIVRIHIPVRTNPGATLQISHQEAHWGAGEGVVRRLQLAPPTPQPWTDRPAPSRH